MELFVGFGKFHAHCEQLPPTAQNGMAKKETFEMALEGNKTFHSNSFLKMTVSLQMIKVVAFVHKKTAQTNIYSLMHLFPGL